GFIRYGLIDRAISLGEPSTALIFSSHLQLVISQPVLFLAHRPTVISTLIPYTPLFRSPFAPWRAHSRRGCGRGVRASASLARTRDRKSTRLNSSHVATSYAVFCLKKKTSNNLRGRVRRRPRSDGW